MGSSSLLLFPSSSSAAPPPTASAAYSHATSSHSLLPPLPSSQDHLLLHYLHLAEHHQESAAAAMVRKRPAPDMDLPPPRRHVTGDLSDVTAAAGAQPHQSAASAQLPALPTQLQLPAFQQQHHHHAHAEVDVPHAPPPAPAEVAASTTAWVDGIIRDIIDSSGGAGVSITQLIHNVREIIHPCNPGLASLLEPRLRSLLNADPAPPPLPHPPALLHGSTPPAAAPTVRPALPPPPPLPVPDKRRHEPQQEEPNPSPQSPKAPTAEETAAAAKERKEEQRRKQRDEEGLHLLTLLLQCAESVNADNLDDAHLTLLEIAELATPFGTSTQRVAAYFAEAMSARLVSSCLGLYALAARLHGCVAAAFQVFSGISPLVKFNGAPTRGSASPTSPTRSAEIGITRAVGRANRIQATAEVGGGSCSAMEDLRPGIRRRRGEDDLLACAADGHDTLLEQADPKEAAPAGDPLVRREHNLRPAAAGVRQRLSSKHAGSRVASVDHAVSSMRQSSSPRLLSMAGSSTATHAEAQSGH